MQASDLAMLLFAHVLGQSHRFALGKSQDWDQKTKCLRFRQKDLYEWQFRNQKLKETQIHAAKASSLLFSKAFQTLL